MIGNVSSGTIPSSGRILRGRSKGKSSLKKAGADGVKQWEAEELAMEKCDALGKKQQVLLLYFSKIGFKSSIQASFLLFTYIFPSSTMKEVSIHLLMELVQLMMV